jgi:hypothetical protein
MKISKVNFLINIVAVICIWHFLMFVSMNISNVFETRMINLISLLKNVDKTYMAFAYLICGIGIIWRKLWSRYLCIFLYSWGFINNLSLIYILKETIITILIVCYVIIYLSIIYFFTRPKVKEQFR